MLHKAWTDRWNKPRGASARTSGTRIVHQLVSSMEFQTRLNLISVETQPKIPSTTRYSSECPRHDHSPWRLCCWHPQAWYRSPLLYHLVSIRIWITLRTTALIDSSSTVSVVPLLPTRYPNFCRPFILDCKFDFANQDNSEGQCRG